MFPKIVTSCDASSCMTTGATRRRQRREERNRLRSGRKLERNRRRYVAESIRRLDCLTERTWAVVVCINDLEAVCHDDRAIRRGEGEQALVEPAGRRRGGHDADRIFAAGRGSRNMKRDIDERASARGRDRVRPIEAQSDFPRRRQAERLSPTARRRKAGKRDIGRRNAKCRGIVRDRQIDRLQAVHLADRDRQRHHAACDRRDARGND